MTDCFDECDCCCGETNAEFDNVASKELQSPITLMELCHSNIGWFSDRSVCDHHLELWDLDKREGVYLLWHKDDYCRTHDMFHMRALYVGKGVIGNRFRAHWKNKDFAEELLIYFTFVEMENRTAKYVEQLLLDSYDFPFNRMENSGAERLCVHFTQSEVD